MEQMEPTCTKGAVPSVKEGHRGSSTGRFPTVDACDSSMTVAAFDRTGIYCLWLWENNREVSIMVKRKRKLTAAEKAQKKRRQKEFMTIFINGKQKRVRRPPTIDGMDVDDFMRRNADPIWLHQNEMWEYMTDNEES